MKEFFVSCNLGFESLLLEELKVIAPRLLGLDSRPNLQPMQFLDEEVGGVALLAPLEVGLQINYFSKIANRVLLRLKRNKVKDFPKMFQLVQALPLNDYLKESKIALSVSASKSRLNNEKRIAEVFNESLAKKGIHVLDSAEQTLYVRMFDDTLEISLDSSGEHLHFRGYRAKQGVAPLRETVASACLYKMLESVPLVELEGLQWVDPMCGSGTFLLEASQLFLPNQGRSYAFEGWKNCPKLMRDKSLLKNKFFNLNLKWTFLGSDIDQHVLESAKMNFAQAKVQVDLQEQDFFAASVNPQEGVQKWLIFNPPWGERISADSIDFVECIEQAFKVWKAARVGVLLPSREAKALHGRFGETGSRLIFKNGGIEVEFLQFGQKGLSFSDL